MTNEELAVMAQNGDTKALHELYEQTHKLIYYILNRLILRNTDKMAGAGATADDAKQLAYFILLDAVEGYKPDTDTKFTAYLNYPAQNRFNELIGYRTAKKRKEPLNAAASLDEPIRDGEGWRNTTI